MSARVSHIDGMRARILEQEARRYRPRSITELRGCPRSSRFTDEVFGEALDQLIADGTLTEDATGRLIVHVDRGELSLR